MRRFRSFFVVLFLSLPPASLFLSAQSVRPESDCGRRQSPIAHPFPHFWEQMFGSGRAILSLRESYRCDLRAVKQITDFRYVRFHAIFRR